MPRHQKKVIESFAATLQRLPGVSFWIRDAAGHCYKSVTVTEKKKPKRSNPEIVASIRPHLEQLTTGQTAMIPVVPPYSQEAVQDATCSTARRLFGPGKYTTTVVGIDKNKVAITVLP